MTLRVPGYSWIGSNTTNGNDYVNNGQQPKILLHMTVSRGLGMSYAQGHPYPPQTWANPYNGDKWQSIELDRAGLALYQPPYNNSWMNKNWYCSQTELVGVPEVNVVTYSEDQSKWIGENVIGPIWQAFQSHGINVNLDNYRYHTNSSGSASEYWGGRMGDDEFFDFNGVLSHIDAFGNDHWDVSVERVDKWCAYAKQWLGQGGIVIPGGGTPPPVDVGTWPGVYLENYTEHPSVASWQAQMVRIGYPLDVDCAYGPASESACMQFQSGHGLVADGIVGPITWNAVFGTSAGSAPTTPPPATVTPPPFVDSGNAPPWPGTYLINFTMGAGTAQWQQQMANRGWTISVDDQYGSQSEEVCMAFQSEKGLQADGVVGPATWAATWESPVT